MLEILILKLLHRAYLEEMRMMVQYQNPTGLKDNIIPGVQLASFYCSPLKYLEKMAGRYGDIAQIQMGKNLLILINHPDYIQSVLQNHDSYFTEKPFTIFGFDKDWLPISGQEANQIFILNPKDPNFLDLSSISRIIYQVAKQHTSNWCDGEKIEITNEGRKLLNQILSQMTEHLVSLDFRTDAQMGKIFDINLLTSALSWSWYLLVKNPQIGTKVLTQNPLQDNLNGWSVLENHENNLAQCFVYEALRLYPPIWVVHRRVQESYILDGYIFPKGASILLSAWVMQRDARFFTDPLNVDPYRWKSLLNPPKMDFRFFPFGYSAAFACYHHLFTAFVTWIISLILISLTEEWRFVFCKEQIIYPKTRGLLMPKQKIKLFLER